MSPSSPLPQSVVPAHGAIATERRSVVFVAAFDSQLKWCANIRDELFTRGFVGRVLVPDVRSALSVQQILDAGFETVDHTTWDGLIAQAAEADVVVCALSGPSTQRLCVELATRLDDDDRPGPVLVSGWVGVIIEKITAGYLDRCGTDLVAVNSAHDMAHFRATAHTLGLPTANLRLTGLPFLSSRPEPQRDWPVRHVLFADQPTVPAAAAERRYLYDRLIAYARRHPDREVTLKPRHRPDEDTFHTMKHHPEDLLNGVDVPSNFRIDYTPIGEVLETVDLLLTMSSTAALEGIDHGCRVAFILDLGVHERYGNHVFLDSGLLRTFDQIEDDDLGHPTAAWIDGYFDGRDRPAIEAIGDRVEELLASGERPSRGVWATPYFRSAIELYHAKQSQVTTWRSRAWPRRMRKHGPVKGTVVHLATLFLPPIVGRPVRRWFRRVATP